MLAEAAGESSGDQGPMSAARGPPSLSETSSRQPPLAKKMKLKADESESSVPDSEPIREESYETDSH
jgi:hypothetical protein